MRRGVAGSDCRDARNRPRKELSLIAMLLVVTSIFSLAWLPTSVVAADLVITDTYVVSGSETWDNVTVTGTGRLILPIGADLNAVTITMEPGSILEATGGSITLLNPNAGGNVIFSGTSLYFNVTDSSIISLQGANGYADTSVPGPYDAHIPTSRGGGAALNITATGGMIIANSTIMIAGGDGFDLPASTADACNAWTNGNPLSGYVAAGGNATMYFNLTSTVSTLIVDNSTLNATGGDGGDAADGGDAIGNNPGEGGGYGNGGIVSGHVGAGGNAIVTIVANGNVTVVRSYIVAIGGIGGHAGDGGRGSDGNWAGGGGGGYGGGHGTGGGSGGGTAIVRGHVGSGGNATLLLASPGITILGSSASAIGGRGGMAGSGGSAGTGYDASGGGGGGFGGGGGTGRTNTGMYPGDGVVSEFVGVGGSARISIQSSSLRILNSDMSVIGNNGGTAGNGGNGGDGGGGGGGGYAGGGGAGDNGVGGNGYVDDFVGVGGNASTAIASDRLIMISSNVSALGGRGGDGGTGGASGGGSWGDGGGGGGGYGGAGGGGGGAYGGGASTVTGSICDGGNSVLRITSNKPSISRDSKLKAISGNGGNAPASPGGQNGGGGAFGGEGEGRVTSDGNVVLTIPMSIPLLLSPANGTSTVDTTPTFEWIDLQNSTTNGDLVEYVIEIDNDPDFSSLVDLAVTTSADYTPGSPLPYATYYWRVKANYSTPPGSSAGWSDVWVLTIVEDTSPPRPPSNLSAVLSGVNLQDVTLIWDLSLDDGDGRDNVVAYYIYRNTSFDSQGRGYVLHASVPNETSAYTDVLAGEGDPENYFYSVCAVNSANNSSRSLSQAGKFTRPLSKGPNLVSIPLVQSNESIDIVLQTVEYDGIWTYDSVSQRWKWFMTFKNYRRDMWNVNHTMGLWVNVATECNLTMAGVVPTDTSIHLSAGWNLVGFPSFNSTFSVSDMNVEVGSTRLEGSDLLPPHHLRVLGDAEVLQTGRGYWVLVEMDVTWTVYVQ